MKIGYVRVSKDDQNPALQHDALIAAGCERIFEDRISGAIYDRKGLNKALKALQPGGELVVWRLDRLGRSMFETLGIVLELDRRGIGFRSLTQSFDTKSAIGRGVLAFFAAVAEDERERIRERTKAGMAAAKRRGKHVGRPRKLSPHHVAHARQLLAGGTETRTRVAALLKVDIATLSRALKNDASCLQARSAGRDGGR